MIVTKALTSNMLRCSNFKPNISGRYQGLFTTSLRNRNSSSFHHTHVPSLSLFDYAVNHQNKVAIVSNNREFTYGQLLADSGAVAERLSNRFSAKDNTRVSFLFDPGYAYVVHQWGIWRSGAVAVPLCNTHPAEELKYYISDSKSALVYCDDKYNSVLSPVTQELEVDCLPVNVLDLIANSKKVADRQYTRSDSIAPDSNAMFVYTSGTTGKPKGVVTTHKQIESQTVSLVDAWKWTPSDRILHVLPLHHVHGIINCLNCALWSGAIVEFMKFDATAVWKRFAQQPSLTLFMAVPTIYVKMLSAFDQFSPDDKELYANAAAHLRLMVSGSAALPDPIFVKWQKITGHTLLERYGMTEIGMALSNPLDDRKCGYVGVPLPGVQVKIVDEQGNQVKPGEPGELLVKGPSVFREYWNKEEATRQAFDSDGWFKTGDTSVQDPTTGFYKILGRNSVDIIKHAGYKISALDIERALLSDPLISECAVVGVPDEEYGQKIAAVVVLKDKNKTITLRELRENAKPHLAYYKLPSYLKIVNEIPRNAMGKVNKKDPFFSKENLVLTK